MGAAIIGGLISSTLLTLVVVPAAYSFIDRFRVWSHSKLSKIFGVHKASADELALLDEPPQSAHAEKTKGNGHRGAQSPVVN